MSQEAKSSEAAKAGKQAPETAGFGKQTSETEAAGFGKRASETEAAESGERASETEAAESGKWASEAAKTGKRTSKATGSGKQQAPGAATAPPDFAKQRGTSQGQVPIQEETAPGAASFESDPSGQAVRKGGADVSGEDPGILEDFRTALQESTASLAADLRHQGGQLAVLSAQLGDLEKLFRQKISHTRHEEQVVDTMHQELQLYKKDLYAQLVRPILLDLVEMRSTILRTLGVFSQKPPAEQQLPLSELDAYGEILREILEKNNTQLFHSSEGTDFAPDRQTVIQKVPTADPSMHRKLAQSLSDGYRYLGKVIVPEKVAVYVCPTSGAEAGPQGAGAQAAGSQEGTGAQSGTQKTEGTGDQKEAQHG